MIKETAYVFDFAPDRTLKMVSQAVSVSSKAGKTTDGDKQILGKLALLHYVWVDFYKK